MIDGKRDEIAQQRFGYAITRLLKIINVVASTGISRKNPDTIALLCEESVRATFSNPASTKVALTKSRSRSAMRYREW
jgi:hypothetical protein